MRPLRTKTVEMLFRHNMILRYRATNASPSVYARNT